MRAKGVKGSTLRDITFEDYLNCLMSEEVLTLPQNLICSKKHDIYTVKQQKICLSYRDDKRNLQTNSFDTLPWGYKVRSSNMMDVDK